MFRRRWSAAPPETYWAGVCRFQRFENGDWRVITSASPLGPIQRTYGPKELNALFVYEDVRVFTLSLDIILEDWGSIFIVPRDIDVQLAIARKIAEGKDPDSAYDVVKEVQRVRLSVTNFMGENFNGGAVNLVEIYAQALDVEGQTTPESASASARFAPSRMRLPQ